MFNAQTKVRNRREKKKKKINILFTFQNKRYQGFQSNNSSETDNSSCQNLKCKQVILNIILFIIIC